MKHRQLSYVDKCSYECGYQHAMTAFYQVGHTRVSPSITERHEFSYAWKDFMLGWRKAQKEYSYDER